MAEWPDYVEYAFGAIEILDMNEDYLHEFTERWGGLGLATFARALREGDRHDQQVSAFAIGYTESTWARDLLLPVLHSEYPEVRWAAALMLGQRHEEAAFPILIDMLQEFLPPHGPADYDWYDVQHMQVASLLGSWGKREAIQPLHDILVKLWQAEQQRSPHEDIQMWWHYQDALVYALGQLEAFDTLVNLDIFAARRRFWMVTLVMGYLNAKHLYKNTVMDLVLDSHLDTALPGFLDLASTLLQEKMGLSAEDADFALKNYSHYYFGRWKEQKEQ